MAHGKSNGSKDSSANPGFEAKLWLSADKPRDNMDAAEYKHVVLDLFFLKYISDWFSGYLVVNSWWLQRLPIIHHY